MNIENLNAVFEKILPHVERNELCLKVCGSYGIYLSSSFLKNNLIGDKLSIQHEDEVQDFFCRNYSPPRDIDLVSVVDKKPTIEKLFLELGFTKDKRFDTVPGIKRSIFYSGEIKIDIFYDGFDFNHFIDLTISPANISDNIPKSNNKRIDTAGVTIPPTELLLQKLQIVRPGQKDLIGAWWILNENEITNETNTHSDSRIILPHISFYTSRQWGFYKTVLQNLKNLEVLINTVVANNHSGSDKVTKKIESIIDTLQNSPKSLSWKTRALLGSKVKWYNEVDEI